MPVCNWTSFVAGIFHDFRHAWSGNGRAYLFGLQSQPQVFFTRPSQSSGNSAAIWEEITDEDYQFPENKLFTVTSYGFDGPDVR